MQESVTFSASLITVDPIYAHVIRFTKNSLDFDNNLGIMFVLLRFSFETKRRNNSQFHIIQFNDLII